MNWIIVGLLVWPCRNITIVSKLQQQLSNTQTEGSAKERKRQRDEGSRAASRCEAEALTKKEGGAFTNFVVGHAETLQLSPNFSSS